MNKLEKVDVDFLKKRAQDPDNYYVMTERELIKTWKAKTGRKRLSRGGFNGLKRLQMIKDLKDLV